MTDKSQRLQEALDRACAKRSKYWLMLHTESLDKSDLFEVEIRIDLDSSLVASLVPPGWKVAQRNAADGMLFLRRRQQLTDAGVRQLFKDALSLAIEHNGRFHSWMHEPELCDW